MAVVLDEWGAVGGDVGGGGRGCATPNPRDMDVCHPFTLPPSCPKCEMAEPCDSAGPYHGHGEKAHRGGGKAWMGGGRGGGHEILDCRAAANISVVRAVWLTVTAPLPVPQIACKWAKWCPLSRQLDSTWRQ